MFGEGIGYFILSIILDYRKYNLKNKEPKDIDFNMEEVGDN